MIRAVTIAITVSLTLVSTCGSTEPHLIIAALRARHAHLRNFSATFQLTETFNYDAVGPAGNQPVPDSRLILRQGTTTYRGEFRFYEGQSRFYCEPLDRRRHAENPGQPKIAFAQSKKAFETLIDDNQTVSGFIGKKVIWSERELLSHAVGLRAFGADEWLDDKFFDHVEIQPDDATGLVKIRWTDNTAEHLWTCDPEYRYAIRGYERRRGTRSDLTLENTDFRKSTEIYMPHRIIVKHWSSAKGQEVAIWTVELSVDQFVIPDARNSEDDFRMAWPLNAVVSQRD
ncbi:MAG: hypothetical protein U0795_22410 [Pirellulales bacterium]